MCKKCVIFINTLFFAFSRSQKHAQQFLCFPALAEEIGIYLSKQVSIYVSKYVSIQVSKYVSIYFMLCFLIKYLHKTQIRTTCKCLVASRNCIIILLILLYYLNYCYCWSIIIFVTFVICMCQAQKENVDIQK